MEEAGNLAADLSGHRGRVCGLASRGVAGARRRRVRRLRALTLGASDRECKRRLDGVALHVLGLARDLAPDALVAPEHRLRALADVARSGGRRQAHLLRVGAGVLLRFGARCKLWSEPLIERQHKLADLTALLVLAGLRGR